MLSSVFEEVDVNGWYYKPQDSWISCPYVSQWILYAQALYRLSCGYSYHRVCYTVSAAPREGGFARIAFVQEG
jgi:hypothetical protein